ncbi:hypothetical protein LX32DRAFT_138020 [Colletotrichum zoysiae]|uniref:Uncharacterized protein n=1 Tax=Colletotrichum zoysiae TaxID=1216348 RepID=A0AAD9M3G2_9PEZI|nr:hypothetical protein LX32DRAFT_138020 [Colletotrichum zoysiae]
MCSFCATLSRADLCRSTWSSRRSLSVPLIPRAAPHEIRGLLEDNNIRCPFPEDVNYAAGCGGSVTERAKSDDTVIPSASMCVDKKTAAIIVPSRPTAVMDAREAAIAEANTRFKDIGRQAEAHVDGFFKKHIP